MRTIPRVLLSLALMFSAGALVMTAGLASGAGPPRDRGLTLSWADEKLAIRGPHLPGGAVEVWYLEAFCRPGSTDRDWQRTVIPHATTLVESAPDGRSPSQQTTLLAQLVRFRALLAEVDFGGGTGAKWLLLRYAPLEKL